jgi:hypothetical protein
MMDKSLNIFFITLLAVGGIVILVVTWLEPMPLSQRVASTFVGAAGIIGMLIWSLVLRSKSIKAHVTSIPDKTDIKKETF